MNRITVTGYVSKKGVEMREHNGTVFAAFNLNAKTANQKQGFLVSCTVWGKRSEIVEEYIHSGDRITLHGRVNSIRALPAVEDKEPYMSVEVAVDDFDLPPRPQRSQESEEDEEVPF